MYAAAADNEYGEQERACAQTEVFSQKLGHCVPAPRLKRPCPPGKTRDDTTGYCRGNRASSTTATQRKQQPKKKKTAPTTPAATRRRRTTTATKRKKPALTLAQLSASVATDLEQLRDRIQRLERRVDGASTTSSTADYDDAGGDDSSSSNASSSAPFPYSDSMKEDIARREAARDAGRRNFYANQSSGVSMDEFAHAAPGASTASETGSMVDRYLQDDLGSAASDDAEDDSVRAD